MKRLYIIAEGRTEERFINDLLVPYFTSKEIYDVRPILLNTSKTSKGGDLNYDRFKPNVKNYLYEDNLIITSLIDFFRLQPDFPKYDEALNISDISNRISFLEKAIADDINDERFIPYIQMHEFEGLLFSDIKGFDSLDISSKEKEELYNIVNTFTNPELINDGPTTAPSKRLEKLISNYRKSFHGPNIASENTLSAILNKCPRFNNWIEKLTELMK